MKVTVSVQCDDLDEAYRVVALLKEEKPNPKISHNGYVDLTMDVREERLRRGLSQQELAQVAGVSMATISKIESGTYRAQAKTLRKIALALNS